MKDQPKHTDLKTHISYTKHPKIYSLASVMKVLWYNLRSTWTEGPHFVHKTFQNLQRRVLYESLLVQHTLYTDWRPIFRAQNISKYTVSGYNSRSTRTEDPYFVRKTSQNTQSPGTTHALQGLKTHISCTKHPQKNTVSGYNSRSASKVRVGLHDVPNRAPGALVVVPVGGVSYVRGPGGAVAEFLDLEGRLDVRFGRGSLW